MLVVSVKWIFALQTTSVNAFVAIRRIDCRHKRLKTFARQIEFHFAHIIVAFRGKSCLVTFEKVGKVACVVENLAWFHCDFAHFKRWQVDHVLTINFLAFWKKYSTQKRLNDRPTFWHMLQRLITNQLLQRYILAVVFCQILRCGFVGNILPKALFRFQFLTFTFRFTYAINVSTFSTIPCPLIILGFLAMHAIVKCAIYRFQRNAGGFEIVGK
jgi:hypothetical protein